MSDILEAVKQAAELLDSGPLFEAVTEIEKYRRAIEKHDDATRGLLPMQPVVLVDGIARFRANECVRYLLDKGGLTLNDLARQNFSHEDQEQFAQLIGYSVDGFGTLSYVSEATFDRAVKASELLPTGDTSE